MSIDCVVMCGGFGSRLKPFTYLIPKPFLTSNDISPFDYTIKNLSTNNWINKIFITIHYKKNYIKKIIKSKKIPNLIKVEEKKPLGTAGCLRLILKKSKSKHIMVINGDIFSKIDYQGLIKKHLSKKCDLTVCVKEHKIDIPYAVLTKNQSKKFIFKEKPTIKKKINTGMYVINTNFLKNFFNKKKENFVGMDEVLKNARNINVFNIGNKWIDIGHIDDFKRAFNEIKNW